MKKMIIASILLITSISFAAATARKTVAEARTTVEQSKTYQDIMKAKEAGFDLTDTSGKKNAELAEKVMKVVKTNLKGLVEVSDSDAASILKLMNINAKEVLAEISRLSSIARDPSVTANEKNMAEKSLELMIKGSHTINSLILTSGRNAEQIKADAQKQADGVSDLVEISRKISGLDCGDASTAFITKYQTALTNGKSIEAAIREASGNKFGEKEMRECE